MEVRHPRLGTVRQVRSPVRFGEVAALEPAPSRHEGAPYVLTHLLGYDDERIQELQSTSAFGLPL